MKKYLRLLLAIIIIFSFLNTQIYAFDNYIFIGSSKKEFSDVPQDSWWYDYIMTMADKDFMQGDSDNMFRPNEDVKLSELTALSVRIYETYNNVSDSTSKNDNNTPEKEPENSDPLSAYKTTNGSQTHKSELSEESWYDSYIKRALEYELLPYGWYQQAISGAPASRAQVAEMLYRAFPKNRLANINPDISVIPDVTDNHINYDAIIALYHAGVITGADKYGAFHPENTICRGELSAIASRLVTASQRKTFTLVPSNISTIYYGKSGAGRDLIAYRLGSGDNLLVLTFAIHGFEDHWPHDGEELVMLAEQLKNNLDENYNLISENNWTVFIVPCANPDGVYDGFTNNGPGRCTTYYVDENGHLTHGNGKGIDLNRCFEYGFSTKWSSRNYTTPRPIAAVEAIALKAFILNHKSKTGYNVFIDVHGWTQQIITSSSTKAKLASIFSAQFPQNAKSRLIRDGYLTDWTSYEGFDSCLFEFPQNIYSHSDFINSGYPQKFIVCVHDILKTYTE